ncbi:MAG: phage protein NinX family protein [Halomonas sp.]|nr:phage protein NinX family protein [Halomonas sp.]
MKIKTSELEGASLDWAVMKVEGWDEGMLGAIVRQAKAGRGVVSPSTDWSRGGPLIEKYRVDLFAKRTAKGLFGAGIQGVGRYSANSYLIAAMRAIVAAELGDEVEVPDELAEDDA